MGVNPPFLYDPVKTEGSRTPYREFDPKAVTRASLTPKPPRPKQDGPLISFNQHPDSFLILPYGNTNARPMNPSVKKWIKWMRIIQLTLRCFEILSALGQLVITILVTKVDTGSATTIWIMRIAPGVAILNILYAIYHLARKPSGRTPASSASYMLFASVFDVSIIPFYAFSALIAATRKSTWKTLLDDQTLTPTFAKAVFYLATVGAGLHVVSLVISLYLAVTFRKITKLPPDMNPLEDNLTSRHKRNKSSMSQATTISGSGGALESKRSSGAVYEDLSRPPTIPFFHTRTQSTDSFSTYKSTPPPSRDARNDLPSRQYQILSNSNSNSPRSSAASDLKRSSFYGPPNPSKRASYHEVPRSETAEFRSSRPLGASVSSIKGSTSETWYTSDSIGKARSKSSSPRKGAYQPLHQRHDSTDDLDSDLSSTAVGTTNRNIAYSHPNPLEANPPTPRHSYHPTRDSPLSEIINLRTSTSGDIADMSSERGHNTSTSNSNFSNGRAGTPQRDLFKAKFYGDLKPATPPIMIGGNNRQVSSGNDFSGQDAGGKSGRGYRNRDVSGKIAEEGLGGNGGHGWGTRLRKISGI